MGFKFMRYTIIRCDLEKVYRNNEYKETLAYAEGNIEVKGVKEQYQKLIAERKVYVQDIKNITEPEKEKEDKKYHDWERWYKKKNLCVWITLGLVAITIINILFGAFLPSVLHTLMTILGLFLVIMVPASIVMKVGELICEREYNNFIRPIEDKIINRSNGFVEYVRNCNTTIDDLYLLSLDPAHREMVLMRREQAKQHEEMMRIERERIELEKERIRVEKARQADERATRAEIRHEAERSRKAQERLLQIEEDREIRYNSR